MELAIDTSTRYSGIALSHEGGVVAEHTWRSEQNHSVELLPAIKALLAGAKVAVGELTAVFVAQGPGGFSALRVGMATAKGLALARGIPIVGVSTLEVEALPYLERDLSVCALIPAGREQFSVAVYRGATEKTNGPASVIIVQKEPVLMTLVDLCSSADEPTLFCGEGVSEVQEALRASLGRKALFGDVTPPTRRPSSLVALGFRRLQRNDTDDLASLQPIYARPPSITMPKVNRR